MPHIIRKRLRIRRRSRAAAPNMIVELGNFITGAVGDVCAGGDAGVGGEDDALVELDCHDGGACGEFAWFEVAGFGGFAGVGV
eukprot:scaffold1177_cov100-Skeletonema_marinoi.AAC.2